VVAAHYNKDNQLNCWTSISDISGYCVDFMKDMALLEQGRGAAWHVWINSTAWQGKGMGTAGARHAMCESGFRGTMWAVWPVRYLYHTVTVCFVL